jgi:CheY-like chemotaxis protein
VQERPVESTDTVVAFGDGIHALHWLESDLPDVVILVDINLPRLGGFEALGSGGAQVPRRNAPHSDHGRQSGTETRDLDPADLPV